MADVLARRTANALFPDARMPLWAAILIGWAVEPVRRRYGGLWVGGTVSVTREAVSFEPNGINRAMHVGDISFTVPLARIRAVRVEPAAGTDIVVLGLDADERRFRCRKAGEIAQTIETARRA